MNQRMKDIGNPLRRLQNIHDLFKELTRNLFNRLQLNSKKYYIEPTDYEINFTGC